MTKIADTLKKLSSLILSNIPEDLLKTNSYEKQQINEKSIFDIYNWKTDNAGMMQYSIADLEPQQINHIMQTLKKYDLHPVKLHHTITVLDEVHLLKYCQKMHPEYPSIALEGKKVHRQSIPLFSKNLPILKMGEHFEVDLKNILTPYRMNKLEQGTVILLGRDVTAQRSLPSELARRNLHGLNLNGADTSVSRLHGYLFYHNKRLYYTDCSTNGTIVQQHKQKDVELNYFKIHNGSRSA